MPATPSISERISHIHSAAAACQYPNLGPGRQEGNWVAHAHGVLCLARAPPPESANLSKRRITCAAAIPRRGRDNGAREDRGLQSPERIPEAIE